MSTNELKIYTLDDETDKETPATSTDVTQNLQNLQEPMVMNQQFMRSGGFVTGVSGWQIDAQGNAEFNSGTFRGTFIIGGTLITVNDITILQSEINAISALGGGTISLVPNTYVLSSATTYTIPSNVTVDGNGSTIDFGGFAGQFLVQGSNAYSTGTLAVSFGSANVVGAGTTWTSAMVGQSILIGDYWYTILTRTDNTHITIQYSPGNGFMGPTISGASYVIATTVDASALNNIALTNSSTTALRFRYVNGFNMNALAVTNSAQAIDGDDSANVNLQGGYVVDDCTVGITYDNVPFCVFNSGLISNITGGTGLALSGVTNTALSALSIQAVTGVGTKLTNCVNFGYDAFSTIECTSHGIEFVSGVTDVDLLSGYVNNCGGDGIKLTATSSRNTIVSCSVLNNTGYGVNVAASSNTNNVISSDAFTTNTAGAINDLGVGTVVRGNVGINDNFPGVFGGTGSDGALVITSGTTTLNMGGASIFVKNYTSISITGTGKLAFSNPASNGTIIVIKSQGNVTLSSATSIDASGMGGAGGVAGSDGTGGLSNILALTNFGRQGLAANGTQATATAYVSNASLLLMPFYRSFPIFCGAGGGGANAGSVNGQTISGGAGGGSINNNGSLGATTSATNNTSGVATASGGNGGAGLVIECAGTYTNTTSTVTVSGLVGGTANNTAQCCAGGGGAGGMLIVLYRALGSDTGTYTVSGGAGGSAGGTTPTAAGGAGANGYSAVYQNTNFA